MKDFSLKFRGYVLRHKVISFIALVIVVIISYQTIKSFGNASAQTLYTLGTATRGTIVSSVSGTGQVSALNQSSLSFKASGVVTYLGVTQGQAVKAGTLLAQVDTTDAAYALENAKLSYDKLVTVDPTTLLKDQNTVSQAQGNLNGSYTNMRSTLVSSLSDMSNLSTGLAALFDINTGYLSASDYSLNDTARNYQNQAEGSYNNFKNLLADLTVKYKNLSSTASNTELESMLSDFSSVAQTGSQSAKEAQDAVIYLTNNSDTSNSKSQAAASAAYTSLVGLVSTANGTVSNLSSAGNSINNNKISLQNVTTDLNNLTAGPDTIALRQAQLSVNQAEETLNNDSVIAPFDGVVASVPVKKGDTVNSGVIAVTLITKQELAQISLNEIDAANVQVGQKATATFDAVPDLTITGKVTSVDLVGTVSQGVVSYNVQITFDVNDARVKPGMSVSVSIITQVKTDVLTVPNSAVKTQGSTSYVEIFDTPSASSSNNGQGVASTVPPRQQEVTTGLANESLIEILSGLTEGQTVVTKISTAVAQTTTNTVSLSNLLGSNRSAAATRATGGGGFVRPAGN